MDLLEHAAGVWSRRYALVGVAVLIAIAVFGVRSTAAEQYDATTTMQVRLPDTLSSDAANRVSFYAATTTGLATSRGVVAQALDDAGRSDAVDDAVGEVSASEGTDPGFLTVQASGPTPRAAAELADALGQVLIEQVAADQAADLADQRSALTDAIAQLGRVRNATLAGRDKDPFEKAALDREREALLGSLRTLAEKVPWRLAVVEPATLPTSASAPAPLRDALLALILVLIVGAELIVAGRAWRGSLSARDPGKDAGGVAGVPGFLVRPDRSAAALTPILPAVGAARVVNVIQSGRAAQARTASLLAELLAARGDDVLLVDAGVERPTVHTVFGLDRAPGLAELRQGDDDLAAQLTALPRVRDVSVLTAGGAAAADDDRRLGEILKAAPQARVCVTTSIASVDDLLDVVRELDGPVVLDVEASTTKRRLRNEVETLRGLGLDLVAVTVSSGSRRAHSRGAEPDVETPVARA